MRNSSLLSAIRSNRKALRLRGLTSADLLALEAVAAVSPSGWRRLSAAALGRLLGVTRQAAARRLARLLAAGALLRLGPALALNVRSLLKWTAEGALCRVAALKRCFERKQERKRNALFGRKGQKEERRDEGGVCVTETVMLIPDRATCVRDLAAMVANRDALRAAKAAGGAA